MFSTKNETMRFLVTNLYRETLKLENYVDNDCPIKIQDYDNICVWHKRHFNITCLARYNNVLFKCLEPTDAIIKLQENIFSTDCKHSHLRGGSWKRGNSWMWGTALKLPNNSNTPLVNWMKGWNIITYSSQGWDLPTTNLKNNLKQTSCTSSQMAS